MPGYTPCPFDAGLRRLSPRDVTRGNVHGCGVMWIVWKACLAAADECRQINVKRCARTVSRILCPTVRAPVRCKVRVADRVGVDS